MEKLKRYNDCPVGNPVMSSAFKFYMKEYYLKEKTFNIDVDVDYIYKKSFKRIVDDFNKYEKIPEEGDIFRVTSDKLKSEPCKISHNIKPLNIVCGVFNTSSSYKPYDKYADVIVSLDIHNLLPYKGKVLITSMGHLRAINNEITEIRLKGAIYHELAHWLSDTQYSSYLFKLVQQTLKLRDTKSVNKKIIPLNLGKRSVSLTHYEIDAQIHAIKQVKRLTDNWDELELIDVFYMYPILRTIAIDLISIADEVYFAWVKDLIKRMSRENLLGKNMKNFPKTSMVEGIFFYNGGV